MPWRSRAQWRQGAPHPPGPPATSRRLLDPGIDSGERQIRQEEPKRQTAGARGRASRDEIEIARLERLVHQVAEPLPRHHDFDDEGSAEDAADRDAVDREDVLERQAERVSPD